MMRTLSHQEAKASYDWLGAKQDSQRFYQDRAVTDLITHAEFHQARSVFEGETGTFRVRKPLIFARQKFYTLGYGKNDNQRLANSKCPHAVAFAGTSL